MTKLVEISPGHFVVARNNRVPRARSDLPMPSIISDTMPAVEQVDGKFYESKAAFRRVGRELGLTEVGNEKPTPKIRASADPAAAKKRRETLRRVVVEYKGGRRPSRTIEA